MSALSRDGMCPKFEIKEPAVHQIGCEITTWVKSAKVEIHNKPSQDRSWSYTCTSPAYYGFPLFADLTHVVRLQITSGRYRTKHGQAIRTEFIEEFVLPDWTCSMYANSSMNSVRIA